MFASTLSKALLSNSGQIYCFFLVIRGEIVGATLREGFLVERQKVLKVSGKSEL